MEIGLKKADFCDKLVTNYHNGQVIFFLQNIILWGLIHQSYMFREDCMNDDETVEKSK